jgi:intracellular septation protein A
MASPREPPTPPDALDLPGPVEPRAILRQVAPRMVRDALGPLAVFFAGWKLVGLAAGISSALVFGVAVLLNERRQGRRAALVRVTLALVCLRAIVGFTSGSATVYLAQEIGIDVLLGTTVLATLAAARPISGWIAADVYPFPPEILHSETFARVMRTITLVWGTYFLVRAIVRLTALLTLSTDSYVLVIALSDAPFLLALVAWSVRYSVAAFRRSEQFGALLAG